MFFPGLFGGGLGLFRLPCLMAGVAGVCFCCQCIRQCRCRARDWNCFKRILRWTGQDTFDDFDLLLLVHEAIIEHKKDKIKTFVRVTAGMEVVCTDPSSRGIFQQPLHVFVEQGTPIVTIELIEEPSQRLLANLNLQITRDILNNKNLDKEQTISMALKGRGVQNPRLKLTMVVSDEPDEEMGLLKSKHFEGVPDDTRILMQQQLRKAESQSAAVGKQGAGASAAAEHSDTLLLKQACAGSLDLFEGFGAMRRIFCGVRGPPDSRGWVLGIWNDKEEYDRLARGIKEIDLRRIKCVGADPQRSNVFVIVYYDERKEQQKLMLRIIDLNRDVWVHMLHLMIKNAHAARNQEQKHPQTGSFKKGRSTFQKTV